MGDRCSEDSAWAQGAGVDLDPRLLLRAYAAGLFPMADSRQATDVFWLEPPRRGILPLDAFHLPRSLAKVLRRETFRHSHDRAFAEVVQACAAPAPGREESWINPGIYRACLQLHQLGHAHSIETWNASGELVGGLYGLRIGAAFFGESMFSRATDASKAALAHLVARLRLGGFQLLDTQFLTPHLARFGGVEISRRRYLRLLQQAIDADADWLRLDHSAGLAASGVEGAEGAAGWALSGAFSGGPSGKRIVQLLSQTS